MGVFGLIRRPPPPLPLPPAVENCLEVNDTAMPTPPPNVEDHRDQLPQLLPPQQSPLPITDESFAASLWPLSDPSSHIWAAVALAFLAIWARSFLFSRSATKAVLIREREKQRAHVERMMAAVLECFGDEEKKARASRHRILDSQRLYHLLWDEAHEQKTSALGTLAHYAEIEALFKRMLADEFRTMVDEIKQVRDSRIGKQQAAAGTDVTPAEALKELGEYESCERLLKAIETNRKVARQLGLDGAWLSLSVSRGGTTLCFIAHARSF